MKLSKNVVLHAVITGTTSRGIFIRLDRDWVLFLSFESYHGPLTLNLSGRKSILKVVEINGRIETLGGMAFAILSASA